MWIVMLPIPYMVIYPIIVIYMVTIIIHHYPSLSIIIHHYPSLSIIIHHYPSLSIIIHHYPSLSIIIHHYPSLSIIIHYELLTIIKHDNHIWHGSQGTSTPSLRNMTWAFANFAPRWASSVEEVQPRWPGDAVRLLGSGGHKSGV